MRSSLLVVYSMSVSLAPRVVPYNESLSAADVLAMVDALSPADVAHRQAERGAVRAEGSEPNSHVPLHQLMCNGTEPPFVQAQRLRAKYNASLEVAADNTFRLQ